MGLAQHKSRSLSYDELDDKYYDKICNILDDIKISYELGIQYYKNIPFIRVEFDRKYEFVSKEIDGLGIPRHQIMICAVIDYKPPQDY